MRQFQSNLTPPRGTVSGCLWAVIMAGGSGTRFWPESRVGNPKQFLDLFGKKTLLEQTVLRLRGVIPPSRVIVVTQQDKVSRVKKLLKIPKRHIIGEPVGRNTAPCAALAAALVRKEDPHAVIALLPADHRIGKASVFKNLLKAAAAVTYQTRLPITFGIEPDHPHVGYGYLEKGKKLSQKGRFSVYRLKRFHEKPSLLKAKRFVKTKRFLWNSGMFVWRADDLLEATRQFLPKVYRLSCDIAKGSLEKKMKRYFKKMPSISIDYGLMEKLRGKILTIPADLDWNDLGGWLSFESLWPQDRGGNTTQGNVVLVESRRSVVKGSRNRLVTLLGVEDLVVVDTQDAVLICSKDKTESVRKIVNQLKKQRMHQYL